MDVFGLAHLLLTRFPRIPRKIPVSFGFKPSLHLLKERELLYSVIKRVLTGERSKSIAISQSLLHLWLQGLFLMVRLRGHRCGHGLT